MSGKLARIALVTLGPLSQSSIGGLATMTAFLQRVIAESQSYDCEVISLANSISDSASIHLLQPFQWLNCPEVHQGEWNGRSYKHVGAYWVELEPQRYRPRAELTELLERFDLVQFVIGYPAWAWSASDVRKPILIWTATTSRQDRLSRTHHMPFAKRTWSWMMIRLAEHYDRKAVRQARFVFALSEYTFEQIRTWIPPDRISVAPCGVDTNLFYPGNHVNSSYLLCVGRLSDPRKNIRLLFHAYSQVVAHLPSAPDLYLVGDFSLTPKFCDLLNSLRISEKVRFLGPRYGAELAEIYRGATMLVVSSDEEGLGIVILEAMASGLPVVSTRCGGPETAIIEGKTGLLTPVGDSQSLAAAIQLLLDDAGLRSIMGRNARQVAVEKFSYASAGRVFLNRYKQILD